MIHEYIYIIYIDCDGGNILDGNDGVILGSIVTVTLVIRA